MARAYVWLCTVCALLALAFVPSAFAACGYESCNPEKPGMFNVHLICHTHTDPGWLITVDQYYYRQVQFILDGIVQELDRNPDRRFTYVEMSYLTRWWPQQDDDMKKKVRQLVNEGRLEFTMGGWAMNDEAGTHYTAIIDQHSLGFDFLRTTLGECARTRVGWQIDPFGHSREQASIFARYGFDGMFFGRLDHQDRDNRKATNTTEFLWHGSPDNLGSSSDLFTGILPNKYVFPVGFWYDVQTLYQQDDSYQFINDDPTLNDYNVDETVDLFLQTMSDYHKGFSTNRVMSTMGADWNYVGALLNFKEMDKLVKYVNARQINGSKVNVLYSTPACYLKALNDDGATWTTKTDDFMPYGSRDHTYWTGFYTSRPALKHYVRQMNSFLQSVKQLSAFANLSKEADLNNVHKLAAAVAVTQHHDAIAGTEKQAVAFDYAQRLSRGQEAGEQVVDVAYSNLMDKGNGAPEQAFCHYLNVSVCPNTTDYSGFEVTMYNPLSWWVTYEAKLPVTWVSYVVYAENGLTVVPSEVFDAPKTPDAIRPDGMTPAPFVLYFEASLPPLGFVTYFVKVKNSEPVEETRETTELTEPYFKIEGKYVSVEFDSSGHVTKMTNKVPEETTVELSQKFFYYLPFVGNNSTPDNQASGAYIFRPANNTPVEIELSSWESRENSVAQEVRQVFNGWLNQTIRVSYGKPYVEFEWTIGPIPKGDEGKEIITRYNFPKASNNGTFYTDSNGRELIQRKLNYRPTWEADIDEAVAGNYFPVDGHIHVMSAAYQHTVVVDRAEGGTSLNDGDLELMLHRRLTVDDSLGVAEALDEPGLDGNGLIVRGSHYVMFDFKESAAAKFRPAAQEIFLSPKLSFSNTNISPTEYVSKYKTKWTGLKEDLPPQVHLLTLQKFKDGGPVASPNGTEPFLVRFEHFYEVNEDRTLSESVTFNLENVFRDLVFVNATELALGGNIAAADLTRLKWKTKDNNPTYGARETPALNGSDVTLNAMQIVTLQIDFKADKSGRTH